MFKKKGNAYEYVPRGTGRCEKTGRYYFKGWLWFGPTNALGDKRCRPFVIIDTPEGFGIR